jgi:uncharacterized protein (DUF433 family)
MSKKYIETRMATAGPSVFIKDSRIRVADIARLYRMIESQSIVERIQESLPSLTLEQIEAAVEYWRTHEEEIESFIEEEDAILETIPTRI